MTAPSSTAGAPSASRSFSTRPTAAAGTTSRSRSTTSSTGSSRSASGSAPTRPAVEVDHEFRTGLRAMLMATAEREGIGATAGDAEPEPPAARPPPAVRPAAAGGHRPPGPGPGRDPGRRGRRHARAVRHVRGQRRRRPRRPAVRGEALHRAGPAGAGRLRHQPRPALPGVRPDPARRGPTLRGDAAGFSAVLDDMDAETREGVRLLTTAAASGRRRRAPGRRVEHVSSTAASAGRLAQPARRRRHAAPTGIRDPAGPLAACSTAIRGSAPTRCGAADRLRPAQRPRQPATTPRPDPEQPAPATAEPAGALCRTSGRPSPPCRLSAAAGRP